MAERINVGSKVFTSKMGAILAAAGSAVGLGNVWRFPTEAGVNGGAAFILIYILFMLILGVPVMVTEFAIGRYGQKGVKTSFLKLSKGKGWWKYMGLFPVIAGILVLSYYAVVAGWTLYYAYLSAINDFAGKTAEQYTADFATFSSGTSQPVLWMFLILVCTGGVVALGVQKGIERGAKLMMPLLFVFIVVLVCCSLTLPGASDGLSFLFYPDFSKVTGAVVLSAMGQAFFSLSVGICCLCTYACYFDKKSNLLNDGLNVATIDTFVAIMSGLIIFPAVYSIDGLSPDAGPSLVFITLPNVFQHVFGGIPVLAYSFSLLFYLLLVMAALTSSISMLEMIVSFFHEELKWRRRTAAMVGTCICLGLGVLCSLSFGILADVTVFGLGFFDLFDFIVAKFFMPVGSLVMCIFLGWVVDEKIVRDEITNGGKLRQPLYPIYICLVRYVAPICIILIFADELGMFDFLKN